ncbi:hydroxymethylbilane synthase [Nakamurella sp. YIM 132084]|uniref:Porphobilinogen deaminase n=1 Tax=Nakamurella leprariae TaxID=2803911 RepID=A0A938YGE8_9ACTN|nr:hydroxymethylbilane synthase [Nakamurella leprariae]
MSQAPDAGGPLLVGTRGSALALAQSGQVAAALAATAGRGHELVRIRTEGDVNLGPLASIGGTGVFVTAVRDALAAGSVDVVVHSLKDLPTAPAPGLTLGAVPTREDPRDAVCARNGWTLATLPRGASVGTGSPRRAAQLLRHRPDLQIHAIRGNVDTRLGHVGDGRLDAVVLAAAGLARLGRSAAVTDLLDPEVMLPAPAQGALAVEARTDAVTGGSPSWYATALATVDCGDTRAAAVAERSLLAALEAGCTAPVGAYATVQPAPGSDTPELVLTGTAIALDGSREFRGTVRGPMDRAAALGRDLAARLLDDGAAVVLAPPPDSGPAGRP